MCHYTEDSGWQITGTVDTGSINNSVCDVALIITICPTTLIILSYCTDSTCPTAQIVSYCTDCIVLLHPVFIASTTLIYPTAEIDSTCPTTLPIHVAMYDIGASWDLLLISFSEER